MEPLHNPTQAATVVFPQAPLGNAASGKLNGAMGGISTVPGMGAKALLAKKMANSTNPKYISPTDNLMTPCSQKLSAVKKKHFTKAPKPMAQLAFIKPNTADKGEAENVRPGAAALGTVSTFGFEDALSATVDGAEAQEDSDKMALSEDEVPAEQDAAARPEDKMDDDENPF